LNFALKSRKHSFNYEKGNILQQMLDNYTRVTDEFYIIYDGQHGNRDKDPKWNNSQSFRMGNVVWPCSLRVIAGLMMFLLRVTNFAMTCVKYLKHNAHGCVSCLRSLRPQYPKSNSDTSSEETVAQSSINQSRSVSAAPFKELAWLRVSIEFAIIITMFVIRMQANIQRSCKILFFRTRKKPCDIQ